MFLVWRWQQASHDPASSVRAQWFGTYCLSDSRRWLHRRPTDPWMDVASHRRVGRTNVRALMERLTSFARCVRFDKRGTGLSDRPPGVPTLEERMEDAHVVKDAADVARAAVLGWSDGGSMAVLFAATYPQRTTSLILYGTRARFVRAPDYPWGIAPDAIWRRPVGTEGAKTEMGANPFGNLAPTGGRALKCAGHRFKSDRRLHSPYFPSASVPLDFVQNPVRVPLGTRERGA